MLLFFTCFKTKLFMMIIGDSPGYDPPITATCGPAGSWPRIDPFLPASSESVRSTVLRYSELASEEKKTSIWVSLFPKATHQPFYCEPEANH